MPCVAATRRHDLSDGQRAALEPVLPASSGRGRPPTWTKRQIIDGIRWRVRTEPLARRTRGVSALADPLLLVPPLAA